MSLNISIYNDISQNNVLLEVKKIRETGSEYLWTHIIKVHEIKCTLFLKVKLL